MKTEDENQPGGYARRRVQRGSVVVVRGSDEGSGDEATWVALVKKVSRGRRCSCGMQEAAAGACVSCTPGPSGQLDNRSMDSLSWALPCAQPALH